MAIVTTVGKALGALQSPAMARKVVIHIPLPDLSETLLEPLQSFSNYARVAAHLGVAIWPATALARMNPVIPFPGHVASLSLRGDAN